MLPKEEAARGRRKAAKAERGIRIPNADTLPNKKPSGVLKKLFNLCTYKLHALGDYVVNIVKFGTSDNYSTQLVGLLLGQQLISLYFMLLI